MRTTATLDTNAIAQVGLRRYLRTVSGRANDLYPAWDSVLNVLYEAERRLFAREGRTKEHGKWEALSPRYAAWKKKHYPGMPRLVLTGRFSGSMTDPSGQHAEIRQRRRLTWGSDRKVSGGHDLGGIHAEGRQRGFAGWKITGWEQLPYRAKLSPIIERIETSTTKHTSYMPAREPIRITQRNVNDIADVIVDHILDFDLSRPRQAWELGY